MISVESKNYASDVFKQTMYVFDKEIEIINSNIKDVGEDASRHYWFAKREILQDLQLKLSKRFGYTMYGDDTKSKCVACGKELNKDGYCEYPCEMDF